MARPCDALARQLLRARPRGARTCELGGEGADFQCDGFHHFVVSTGGRGGVRGDSGAAGGADGCCMLHGGRSDGLRVRERLGSVRRVEPCRVVRGVLGISVRVL